MISLQISNSISVGFVTFNVSTLLLTLRQDFMSILGCIW